MSNDNKKIFALVGLICSSVGFLFTMIFSIITCSRGYQASKVFKYWGYSFPIELKMSKFVIGIIFGIIIDIVGIVFAILSYERGAQVNKLALIALIVGCVALFYGVMTTATICGYNCSYNHNNKMKKIIDEIY